MNEWLSENWEAIRLMAKKICKSHSEWEEVCSYSIEKFMIHERAEELVESGRGMNFISGIMHRSFYSSTSFLSLRYPTERSCPRDYPRDPTT